MNILPCNVPHNAIIVYGDGSLKIGLKGRYVSNGATISINHMSYPSRGERVCINSLLCNSKGLIAGYDPVSDDGQPSFVAEFKEGDILEIDRPKIFEQHSNKWSTETLKDSYVKPAISGLYRVTRRKAWVDGQGWANLVVCLIPVE